MSLSPGHSWAEIRCLAKLEIGGASREGYAAGPSTEEAVELAFESACALSCAESAGSAGGDPQPGEQDAPEDTSDDESEEEEEEPTVGDASREDGEEDPTDSASPSDEIGADEIGADEIGATDGADGAAIEACVDSCLADPVIEGTLCKDGNTTVYADGSYDPDDELEVPTALQEAGVDLGGADEGTDAYSTDADETQANDEE